MKLNKLFLTFVSIIIFIIIFIIIDLFVMKEIRTIYDSSIAENEFLNFFYEYIPIEGGMYWPTKLNFVIVIFIGGILGFFCSKVILKKY